MTDTADLVHIEQIKIVKARYCRLIDTKHWDELAALLTPEFTFVDEAKNRTISGATAFLEWVSDRHARSVSVHQSSSPEITVEHAGAARGVWAMHDVVRIPQERGELVQRGYGHYHDEFHNDGTGWRLARLRLTRIWLSVAEETHP